MLSAALGKRHWTLIPYVGRSIGGNEGNRLAMNSLKTLSCQNFPDYRILDSHSCVLHASLPQSSYPHPCKPEQADDQSPLLMSDTEAEKCPQMTLAAKETQSPSRHSFDPDANSDICILPSSFLQRLELLEKCWCFTREGYGRILYCVSLKQGTTPFSHSL